MSVIPESENQFQRVVLDLARWLGWRSYHTHDSRRSVPGFPDLCLAKPDHPLLLVELKSATGRITVAQQGWLDVLAQSTGVQAGVWRPGDWDKIETILQGAPQKHP